MSLISRLFAKAPNSHSQTDLAEVFSFLASTGYKRNSYNDLEVIESSPAAMTVSLSTGQAWIEGYYAYNDAAAPVTIEAADGALNRIDRVILRCDYLTNLEITVEVLKGTAAATPTAPALTRAGGIYEISLAQIYVGAAVVAIYNANITDERDDPTLCGVAQGLAVAKVSQLHSLTMPILNGAVTAAGKPALGTYYGVCNNGDDLYFAGGTGGAALYKYSSDVWTSLTATPTALRQFDLIYYTGALYAISGNVAGSPVAETRIYTISTDTWSTGTVKPIPTYDHGAVEVGGNIYFFGGNTGAGYNATTEIYNIAGDTWSTGAGLPVATTGRVYACTDGTDIWVTYNSGAGVKFYKYSISSDSFGVFTSPAGVGYIFYRSGYIWNYQTTNLRMYNITDDAWSLLASTNGMTGITYPVGLTSSLVAVDNSKTFTYVYKLGSAVTEYILGFRKRLEADLGLMNITTLTTGTDSVCTTTADDYGIYVNDTALTGSYEVEIYG